MDYVHFQIFLKEASHYLFFSKLIFFVAKDFGALQFASPFPKMQCHGLLCTYFSKVLYSSNTNVRELT